MAKENIFDLSKILSMKNNDVEIRGAKKQQQPTDELLEGYELVDPSKWDKIPYKTHIRYRRTDGEMKKGGYVVSIVHTKDLEGNPTIKIDLVSGFIPTAIKWSVYKGSIDRIWKKIEDTPDSTMADLLKTINDELTFCKQSIEQLTKKLQQNENENKRIIDLIKKLHKLN